MKFLPAVLPYDGPGQGRECGNCKSPGHVWGFIDVFPICGAGPETEFTGDRRLFKRKHSIRTGTGGCTGQYYILPTVQFARIAPYAAGIKNGVPAYILLDAEIEMILRCLKGIVTIQQENFIADLPAFIQPYVGFHVLSLANAHTVSQLIEILERTPYGPLLEKCAAQKEGPLYSRFVQMVYEWYFDTLM